MFHVLGQCHIAACKYVQVAILSCTRQKGIAETHDAGEDLAFYASCGHSWALWEEGKHLAAEEATCSYK